MISATEKNRVQREIGSKGREGKWVLFKFGGREEVTEKVISNKDL